ncbi:WD40 repeat [Lentzea aerocolonigenes]|nr:WD40 repeat [Lentzea aerocolonigenes]
MPRGERPLDDGDGPVLRFAADLRRLRASAGGLSYRELARRSHFSSTALSDAAGGRRLPGLEVVLGYVRACGGDEEQWRQRWHDVAAELAVAQQVPPARAEEDGPAPYVGLAAFGAQDADRFFGRETVVETLLARLVRQRFVAVFGASGEGKSSLLRAGLAPRIRAVVFTPGPNPVEECAVRLAAHTGRTPGPVYEDLLADPLNLHRFVRCASPDDDLVLVIDQFEEIFTLCAAPSRRSQFIDMLLAAVVASNSRTRVVLGVRSDFYPHCAQHPALAAALTDAQILLGAMTPDELRRAITQPAVKAGCSVEAALLTTLVAEAAGRSGVLPLVSHALLETWRRRRGHSLTLAGYQAAGGIHGALARSAEAVFAALPADQRTAARHLFLRLTALGEGTEDTKRRIGRAEVPETGPVLDVLAGARLITLDQDSVEITHEALFRAWPRLREWLAEDRDGLRIHHQLTEAARIWDELGRDTGALYRTTRLALTSEWADRAGPALTAREQQFLTASWTEENAERTAARRRTRQLRWLAAGLAALLVLATAGAGIAVYQRRETERLSLITQSRQLAALSQEQAATNPEESIRTALQAYNTYPTVEARSRLLTANAARPPHHIPLAHDRSLLKGAYSPDGTIFAVLDGRSQLTLYDCATLTVTSMVSPPAGADRIATFALSQDGRTVAVADDVGRLFLVDRTSPSEPEELGVHVGSGLNFSADGRSLVAAGATTTAIWDVASGRKRRDLAVRGTHAIASDSRTLAIGDGGELQVWDIETGERRGSYRFGDTHISRIRAVPNSSLVVVSFEDSGVVVWDTAAGAPAGSLPSHEPAGRGVAVSADGTTIAVASKVAKVNLWDIQRGIPRGSLIIGERALGLEFAPDGTLAVLSSNAISFWPAATYLNSSLPPVQALSFDASGSSVLALTSAGTVQKFDDRLRSTGTTSVGADGTTGRFSPDRTLVAVASPGKPLAVHDLTSGRQTHLTGAGFVPDAPQLLAFKPDSHALLAVGRRNPDAVWRLDRPDEPTLIGSQPQRAAATFGAGDDVVLVNDDGCMNVRNIVTWRTLQPACDGPKNGIALSPDRRWLAVATSRHIVTVWDTTTWRVTVDISDAAADTIASPPNEVAVLAFSPDSARLAISSTDHKITVWDIPSGQNWATLSDDTHNVTHLAWHPDGHALVSASTDNTLHLWPLDVDEAVHTLRLHVGPR